LGVSKGTLNSWRYQQGLPYLKIGGKIFYSDRHFAEWASKCLRVREKPEEEPEDVS